MQRVFTIRIAIADSQPPVATIQIRENETMKLMKSVFIATSGAHGSRSLLLPAPWDKKWCSIKTPIRRSLQTRLLLHR